MKRVTLVASFPFEPCVGISFALYLVGVAFGEVQNLPLLFACLSLAVDIVEKKIILCLPTMTCYL